MLRRAWIWCLGMLLVCHCGANVAHAQHFTSLPIPSGPRDQLVAADINDSGVIVGSYGAQAFLLQDGLYTFFAVSGADQTGASGINNLGQVVGSYVIDVDPSPDGYAPEQRAFLWQSGSFTTLPQVGATTVAYDINDAGVIVGGYFSDTGGSTFIASAGGIQTLAIPGQQYTVMTGINNDGVLVGQAFTGSGVRSNWRYAHGAFAPLTLPATQDCPDPVVVKVNDGGAVVGECVDTVADPAFENSTFVANGTLLQVLRFPGAVTTFPGGINGQGSVVGYYWDSRDISAYLATFPSLSDPVPDLLSSDGGVEATDFESLSTNGRPVQGVAADGVARVIVKLPATTANQPITVRLLNDHEPRTLSTSAQEDGALLPLDAQSSPVSQLTVNAVTTDDGPAAFLLYRAPEDFPREGAPAAQGALGPDDLKASRQVFLEITPQGETSYIKAVEIVRPPVLLVHGLWSNEASWDRFSPLTLDSRFNVSRADFSFAVPIATSVPEYSPDTLSRVRANSLGLSFNAITVSEALLAAVEEASSGSNPARVPIAAVQADIVGHSMGGLIARHLATEPQYAPSRTFGAGLVNKLVTVDTPHLGSPIARRLLADEDKCLRTLLTIKVPLLAEVNNFALSSVVLSDGRQVGGALNDLASGPLSDAILRLNGPQARPLPTFFISGRYDDWPALDTPLGRAAKIRFVCGAGANLADALTAQKWPAVFGGQDNDAIVSVTSQLNGGNPSAPPPFAGRLHSRGTQQLGFAPPSIQNPGPVPVLVTEALNAPAYGPSFRLTPQPSPQ